MSEPDATPTTSRPRSTHLRARDAARPAARAARRAAGDRRDPDGLAEVAAASRRHRPGRDRRRARLRLPLLRPGLPDPAAPGGRRDRAGRPDRVRRPRPRSSRRSTAPSGSCTPPSQDLPCLAEVGLRPGGALRHRARRPAARLPPGRPGHAGRGAARLPAAQGALGGGLVDAPAARALAGVRRARRRAARRAARRRWRAQLVEAGKREWARAGVRLTCVALPPPNRDPSRGVVPPGCTGSAAAASLAAVRALWHARDEIAAERDVTPGRIVPDSAIIEAATALPRDKATLLGLKGFHGRGAHRYAASGSPRCARPASCRRPSCRPPAARYDGPPPPRAWSEKDPAAAARLAQARTALAALAEELHVPVENLLTPDYVRRVLWTPPAPAGSRRGRRVPAGELGARPWQVGLTAEVLATAIADHPS